ncbi:MAG: carboxypeptidase-like regulatory domain-containing protein [Leeuwenhoekiella sp.]
MKVIALACTFFLTLHFGFGQQIIRPIIEGHLIVPEGDSPEGIVIYNITTGKGTITNEAGYFFIAVKPNDQILVQSIQFDPVTVNVSRAAVTNEDLVITLRESVNELNEVVVKPYDLSGDISADVAFVPLTTPPDNPLENRDTFYETHIYDTYSKVVNPAFDDEQWRTGLNFVNIYKAIFKKHKKNTLDFKKSAGAQIVELYNDRFFHDNLDLQQEEIEPFLVYTEKNGLNDAMLASGNELNLIQFLLKKRQEYKDMQRD